MTSIRVIAAVIERDGRWLVGQRPPEKRHGGLWEFPGGKVESGETPLSAVRRELSEELALHVDGIGDLLLAVSDAGAPFLIEFFPVAVSGTPEALEHSKIGWFSLDGLRCLPLAPADASFVEWLASAGRGGPHGISS